MQLILCFSDANILLPPKYNWPHKENSHKFIYLENVCAISPETYLRHLTYYNKIIKNSNVTKIKQEIKNHKTNIGGGGKYYEVTADVW